MNTTKNAVLTWAIVLATMSWPIILQGQTFASTSGTRPGSGQASPLTGKLYFGFDGGVALQQDVNLSDGAGDSETVSFDPGARLDMQLGYHLTTYWAAELEFGLITSPVKYSYALGTDYMGVDLTEFPVLVNVIYSRPLGRRFSVYVGGGVGGVFSRYQDQYGDTTPTASTFGFQGLAGVDLALGKKWKLGFGYKFLGTTGYDVGSGIAYDGFTPTEYHSDGNMTHSILVTFCRNF